MPDTLGPASEFGGKVQKNGVQPPPHVPTPSERLMLLYRTGDESGMTNQDAGEAMEGLLPVAEQTAIRKAEGVLEKGQVWDEIQEKAKQEIQKIADEQGPIA